MTFEDDPLVEIDQGDLPKVQDILKEELPRSLPVYCWIQTRLKWKNLNSNANQFHVCTPAGGIKDGLIVFGKLGHKTYYLTIYTFHNETKALEKALLETRRINWNEKLCCGVPMQHTEWMKKIIQAKGFRVYKEIPSNYYELDKEAALSFNETSHKDVYIAPLQQENLEQINSVWPHRFTDSLQNLSETLKLNFGYGVYSKTDNSLLSWVMKCEYGEMGVLQTEEEHKRQGYARMVIKALCKRMAEEDDTVYVYIVIGNTASEKLFHSLGFTYSDAYNFIVYNN